jgi:AraC family transcriptional regulator of arabinose operon
MDCRGEELDYCGVKAAPRAINDNVFADPIVCSEFRVGVNYTNWRPQGSGDFLLIYTVAGGGAVRFPNGRIRALRSGDAVLFGPKAVQDYFTAEEASSWHLQWVHFSPRPHWRNWLRWPEAATETGFLTVGDREKLQFAGAMERMLVVARLGTAASADLAMNALEEALIHLHQSAEKSRHGAKDERVLRAAHYLATHPGKPFHLPDLAAHCGLSLSRLSRLFKEEMRTTPQRFGERIKMECAADLLRQTNLSIGQVAAEVGFSDVYYFTRRFRRFARTTPSEYRKKQRR